MFALSRLLLISCLALAGTAQAGEQGYYSWPIQAGDDLIFASEGDLWRAAPGAAAQRLTSHEEEESHPALSPDGQWLAFDAHYDGARAVYVMPAAGGSPRQVTFEGGGTQTVGWTPDGQVLYRSRETSGPQPRLLRQVDPESLAVTDLPLDQAGDATLSSDGRWLFFTRFGLDGSGDNTRLYRGGRMAQLWRYDLSGAAEAERLAAGFGAPLRHPHWWQGRLYLISDRSGSDNIWSFDEAGGDARQESRFDDSWQLLTPSLDRAGGRLLYQRGADLYAFDLASGQEAQLQVSLVSDRDGRRTRWLEDPLRYLEASRPGARGEAVAITARGQIALAFPSERRRVELPVPPGTRAREAVVGSKGDWVYALLDQGTATAVWRFPADGRGPAQRVTGALSGHVWSLHLDPSGRYLLYEDKSGRLWLVDLEGGLPTATGEVLDASLGSEDEPFFDFAWSRDGRYLAYVKIDARQRTRVVLLELETRRSEILTTPKYESYGPAFSKDGAWLYFLSERHFQAWPRSPWGDRNMGPSFDRRTQIYALQLIPGSPFPFEAPSELEERASEDEEESEAPRITWQGLADRLWLVPVEAGNYYRLSATEEDLYLLDWDEGQGNLLALPLDWQDPELDHLASDVADYRLVAEDERLFLRFGWGADSRLFLLPTYDLDQRDDYRLRLGDWRLAIDPPAEWRQMFFDVWRTYRDFAFDPDLRGLDWQAIRQRYEPLVARLGSRAELDDLLEQMVAELGILHTQVRGADLPEDAEAGEAAFLGARFQPHAEGLEITQIYEGERDRPETLGPLLQPGLDIGVGAVVTAINGEPLESLADLGAALQHQAGQELHLDLLEAGARRSALVEPVNARSARTLRYSDWVADRTARVAETGDGRIGYLHLRALRSGDIASFARDFYDQVDKHGLIIDLRGNWGGNVDSWVLATLLRRVWSFWDTPEGRKPYGNMQATFRGHLAVLIDQGTYSDGETLAAGFRALELAPLIGTRTSGAGIWLTDRPRLADRGRARIAEFAQFDLEGRQIIEGVGVAPDITVETLPRASYAGEDAQLEAALDYLSQRIVAEPVSPLVPDLLYPFPKPPSETD
ncbi:MAG: S41 family peptidase [Pseudomonadota bacterium]